MFMMALGALVSKESMLKPTTLEILLKFLLNMYGQGFALCVHHITEFRVVLLDNLVKKGWLRSVAFVGWTLWRPIHDRCLKV
jgi:hypothetical protein